MPQKIPTIHCREASYKTLLLEHPNLDIAFDLPNIRCLTLRLAVRAFTNQAQRSILSRAVRRAVEGSCPEEGCIVICGKILRLRRVRLRSGSNATPEVVTL